MPKIGILLPMDRGGAHWRVEFGEPNRDRIIRESVGGDYTQTDGVLVRRERGQWKEEPVELAVRAGSKVLPINLIASELATLGSSRSIVRGPVFVTGPGGAGLSDAQITHLLDALRQRAKPRKVHA